jgi:hypothetical protein
VERRGSHEPTDQAGEQKGSARGRGVPATLCSIEPDGQRASHVVRSSQLTAARRGLGRWQQRGGVPALRPSASFTVTASAGEIAVIQQRPGSLKRPPPHAVPARCPSQLQIKSSR